jgi:AhpC/TSA family
VGEVSPLNELYQRYRDQGFEFFTIYVREPHPGEHYGPHRTWEQKLKFARDCREQDGIHNPMLVDDLEGTVHRLYGLMPNMIYIIDKNGKIAYKAMWTDHREIGSVLENLMLADHLQSQGVRVKPSYTERINYIPAEYAGGVREKVFDRAGSKAWVDYQKVFDGG